LDENKARILNPASDILFRDDHIVIILDGWHPLKEPLEEGVEDNLESEEEGEEEEIEKKEEKPKEPEAKPEEFSCGICTMLNPINKARCEMCDTPRPPMEEIMAAFTASMAPDVSLAPENDD